MERAALEARAKELGLSFDTNTSNAKLKDAIAEAGKKAAEANEDQGTRFAEGQAPNGTQPVDDERPQEFKKNAELDKVNQPVKASEKLFPVKLLKNYRPVSTEAQIQGDDGEYRPMTDEEASKVKAGEHILLPVGEAKRVLENKIAERNDPVA